MSHPDSVSVADLRLELSKLSAQEQLALADYLVQQAESSAEASPAQIVELDRRSADALARPETLLSPEEAHRRVRR